jgi:hypothetical protein
MVLKNRGSDTIIRIAVYFGSSLLLEQCQRHTVHVFVHLLSPCCFVLRGCSVSIPSRRRIHSLAPRRQKPGETGDALKP